MWWFVTERGDFSTPLQLWQMLSIVENCSYKIAPSRQDVDESLDGSPYQYAEWSVSVNSGCWQRKEDGHKCEE